MDTVNRSKLLAKSEVKAAIREMQRALGAALPEAQFSEFEEVALAVSDEVVRRLLEQRLQTISDAFSARVSVRGDAYKLHEPGAATYHSLCGPLDVRRATYREIGVRNGPTVVPLELVAGIVEGATPALGFNVAHGYAQHDMRAHCEGLRAAHRRPPPRATLERMAKRIANAAHDSAPSIERAVRRTEKLPDGAHAVVQGLDRTSVPMAEPRPADAQPKPAPKRTKPRVRKAPAPIDVNYRMAYVGTVTIVNSQGEALVTRRYAAPASDDPSGLVSRMTADVRAAVGRNPELSIGLVQDGAPEMWNLVRDGLSTLQNEGLIEGWEEGIDRYHLLERLAKALCIVEPDSTERIRRLNEWKDRLDRQDSAVDSIEHYFKTRYSALPVDQQTELWDHLVYLRNNKDRMRYVTLATAGLPVGSGVTESAAKTVVGRRAKSSGQRWSVPGLRGALTLRAIHQSQRLHAFWSRFQRRYTAHVQAA